MRSSCATRSQRGTGLGRSTACGCLMISSTQDPTVVTCAWRLRCAFVSAPFTAHDQIFRLILPSGAHVIVGRCARVGLALAKSFGYASLAACLPACPPPPHSTPPATGADTQTHCVLRIQTISPIAVVCAGGKAVPPPSGAVPPKDSSCALAITQ